MLPAGAARWAVSRKRGRLPGRVVFRVLPYFRCLVMKPSMRSM